MLRTPPSTPSDKSGKNPPEADGARRLLHTRSVVCEGFARDDGLFDIEGTLIDSKPFAYEMRAKSLAAHEPVHHMMIRLTLDHERWIRDVHIEVRSAPFPVCPEIVGRYRQLIGRRIEAGFTLAVKRLFRGAQGCTHLTELIPIIATSAMQTIWTRKEPRMTPANPVRHKKVSPLDGCHALQSDGAIIKRYYRPPEDPANGDQDK